MWATSLPHSRRIVRVLPLLGKALPVQQISTLCRSPAVNPGVLLSTTHFFVAWHGLQTDAKSSSRQAAQAAAPVSNTIIEWRLSPACGGFQPRAAPQNGLR